MDGLMEGRTDDRVPLAIDNHAPCVTAANIFSFTVIGCLHWERSTLTMFFSSPHAGVIKRNFTVKSFSWWDRDVHCVNHKVIAKYCYYISIIIISSFSGNRWTIHCEEMKHVYQTVSILEVIQREKNQEHMETKPGQRNTRQREELATGVSCCTRQSRIATFGLWPMFHRKPRG